MENDIILLGYGGHAKSVADSIVSKGKYRIIGYTDIVEKKCDYPYIGNDDALKFLFQSGLRYAVLGIGYLGNSFVRDQLVQRAKAIGYEFPVIVDPTAVIAMDAKIGEGTYVGKTTVINTDSVIGNYCIVNTGAVIEHENIVGDYSHISVGAKLCGNVSVEDHSFIGAGSTVIQGVSIGKNVIIGANSTVLNDVKDGMKEYGIIANRGI